MSAMLGTVSEIYITAQGGDAMEQVEVVEAVAGRGLRGDRYMNRAGHWSGGDACQVTLIEEETLEQIRADNNVCVANGEHRRNVITRGIRLHELAGKRFRVGEAVLEHVRPRPPCSYLQSITQPGMKKALRGARGGICARVVKSGTIRPDDAVEVL